MVFECGVGGVWWCLCAICGVCRCLCAICGVCGCLCGVYVVYVGVCVGCMWCVVVFVWGVCGVCRCVFKATRHQQKWKMSVFLLNDANKDGERDHNLPS